MWVSISCSFISTLRPGPSTFSLLFPPRHNFITLPGAPPLSNSMFGAAGGEIPNKAPFSVCVSLGRGAFSMDLTLNSLNFHWEYLEWGWWSSAGMEDLGSSVSRHSSAMMWLWPYTLEKRGEERKSLMYHKSVKINSAVHERHIKGSRERIWRFKCSEIHKFPLGAEPIWHSLTALLDSCWIYTPCILKSHWTESSEPQPKGLFYTISGI